MLMPCLSHVLSYRPCSLGLFMVAIVFFLSSRKLDLDQVGRSGARPRAEIAVPFVTSSPQKALALFTKTKPLTTPALRCPLTPIRARRRIRSGPCGWVDHAGHGVHRCGREQKKPPAASYSYLPLPPLPPLPAARIRHCHLSVITAGRAVSARASRTAWPPLRSRKKARAAAGDPSHVSLSSAQRSVSSPIHRVQGCTTPGRGGYPPKRGQRQISLPRPA